MKFRMPDSFFSKKQNPSDEVFESDSPQSQSGVTAVVKIAGMEDFLDDGGGEKLHQFSCDLANEIYNLRRQNYGLGLRALEPAVNMSVENIYLHSPLFLEKDLHDLSSITFKLFIDYCNLLLATAIKNEVAVCGLADIVNVYNGQAYSGDVKRAPSKESLVLSDLLEVFSFEEIFPDGFGQKIIPPANVSYFYGKDLQKILRELRMIKEIGIFMPSGIEDYPATELAIYSDMLIETSLGDKDYFSCNWKTAINKNPDSFVAGEMFSCIKDLVENKDVNAGLWKKFLLNSEKTETPGD